MKKLAKIYEWLLLILPAVLFFSYRPLFSLGATTSMNLELSLPLIWLVIFDLLSLVLVVNHFPDLKKRFHLPYLLILLFPLFLTISIFWSLNPLRALLTASILWLIIFAVFAIIFLTPLIIKKRSFSQAILKSILLSAVIISAWCWLQCLLDLVGMSRDFTLMCAGCTTTTFGFPHPNGFAIEPQFMGNLLLFPAIIALYLWLERPSWRRGLVVFFLSATLFLTFSRGAIYSFGVAVAFLFVMLIIRAKSARPLILIPMLLGAFLFTLNAQGLMAQFSVTDDTYLTGIAKSINQLSLGLIDFRPQPSEITQTSEASQSPEASDLDVTSSTFDGYVEESTNTRLRLTAAAFNIWRENPTTMFFGVGLGGAGEALYRHGDSPAPKEIVQNEYASLLLETGLVGIITLLIAITVIIYYAAHALSRPAQLLLATIILAYALSLLFFSGLPNALHIYLLPSLLALFHGIMRFRPDL